MKELGIIKDQMYFLIDIEFECVRNTQSHTKTLLHCLTITPHLNLINKLPSQFQIQLA